MICLSTQFILFFEKSFVRRIVIVGHWNTLATPHFFISIVIVQRTDLIICKTRRFTIPPRDDELGIKLLFSFRNCFGGIFAILIRYGWTYFIGNEWESIYCFPYFIWIWNIFDLIFKNQRFVWWLPPVPFMIVIWSMTNCGSYTYVATPIVGRKKRHTIKCINNWT